MPKIINSLKERIKEESTTLFCELGFDKVDMKRIAKSCDIAVGTLYNYYPNKKELYISIVKESWDQTFRRMESVYIKEESTEENLKSVIKVLYEDIIHRQGIGSDVVAFRRNGHEEFTNVKDEFVKNISIILDKFEFSDKYKKYEKMSNKIASMLLASTVVFISFDSKCDEQSKEESIEALVDSIRLYYK